MPAYSIYLTKKGFQLGLSYARTCDVNCGLKSFVKIIGNVKNEVFGKYV
jgi:hypothetical protein